MKIEKALKQIIRTGKITYGTKETLEEIKKGNAKIVIIAQNTPIEIENKIKEEAQKEDTPIRRYRGTSKELGETCKRPHLTTTVAIKDTGSIDKKEIEQKN